VKVSAFLERNASLFPSSKGKKALDLAPSVGDNAFYLAKLGYAVEVIEPDREKANDLALRAERSGTHLKIIVADPSRIQLSRARYALMLCFYYVNRAAILQMKNGLAPLGIILMEALILKPKELQFFFKDFTVLKYEERLDKGPKAVASIIAQKS